MVSVLGYLTLLPLDYDKSAYHDAWSNKVLREREVGGGRKKLFHLQCFLSPILGHSLSDLKSPYWVPNIKDFYHLPVKPRNRLSPHCKFKEQPASSQLDISVAAQAN